METKAEQIERLKSNLFPLMSLSEADQKFLKEIDNTENIQSLTSNGLWTTTCNPSWSNGNAYRIHPGYQPEQESEYVEYELKSENGEYHIMRSFDTYISHQFVPLTRDAE